MKKMMETLAQKAIGFVPALAMMMAVSSVSATCFFLAHQPNIPDALNKYEM